jgi:hypothetical protein
MKLIGRRWGVICGAMRRRSYTCEGEEIVAKEVRRSARNMGGTMKIQEKAEASKKKYNEISSKSSYFSILNSVDPQILKSIALVSNINLGNDDSEVATSISMIQANEC